MITGMPIPWDLQVWVQVGAGAGHWKLTLDKPTPLLTGVWV